MISGRLMKSATMDQRVSGDRHPGYVVITDVFSLVYIYTTGLVVYVL